MALTKRSENAVVYLEAKYYCLWRSIKKQVSGCEEMDVPNPRTGERVKKYGYRYDTVSGIATKLVKYDTAQKYGTRYFGFKLHLADGAETYVIDMPYNSQLLRRFLHVAHNMFWDIPLSITVFKGKKGSGEAEPTGVWFQQRGQTVKPYYTREQLHGMPEATFDDTEQRWDFKAQHRWLVERLQAETIPDIEAAAAKVAPPIEPEAEPQAEHEPTVDEGPPNDFITDDDVPF